MGEEAKHTQNCTHVLLLPYPCQGHINPMLEFGKRLAFHGLKPTLATTRFILSTTNPDPGLVSLAPISDGFDKGGFYEVNSVSDYVERLELVGSETLDQLLQSESSENRPVGVLVYDSFLPWAAEVARKHNISTASFFTQPCCVDLVIGHVWKNQVQLPVQTDLVHLPGLPELESESLPSFTRGVGSHRAYFDMVMNQFKGLDKAGDVFINSFFELEPQEAKYMESAWRAKTIGPTVPSLQVDSSYGFHLYTPTTAPCIAWLETKPPRSVIYASFGSMVCLDPTQMEEVANGLYETGKPFLWVVRASEAEKMPENFTEMAKDMGYIVPWSPQLEVLAHESVGCFLSHCGWNSTIEALVLGVPIVAMPQWSDQPMNAKYIESFWKVGKRVNPDRNGLVQRDEIVRCVKEVMEGERSEEYRSNAKKWREMAQEAIREGGSSYKNIKDFVTKYESK